MKWMYVLLGFLSNAIASALIKFAIMPPRLPLSWERWDALFLNFPLWAGVVMGCIAWIFYREALRRFPENMMLLLMMGSILIVTIVSWTFLSASVMGTLALGLVLSIVGLMIWRFERIAMKRSAKRHGHAVKHRH